MPLDNAVYRTTPDVLATGFEGLRQLSTELKNTLPYNFTWDFSTRIEKKECGYVGCALGLAKTLWPEQMAAASICALLNLLGMDKYQQELDRIFGTTGFTHIYDKDWDEITPQDVAAKLDSFILENAE